MELNTTLRNGNISFQIEVIHDKDRTVDYEGGFLLMHELIRGNSVNWRSPGPVVKKRLIAVRPQSISFIRFEDEEDQLCHHVELSLTNGQNLLVHACRKELLEILDKAARISSLFP